MKRSKSETIRCLVQVMTILIISLLLREGRGYRPFPSIDDFAYIPLSEYTLNSQLFPGDEILRTFNFHLPVWPALVWAFDRTLGLPLGFWLCTVALSIASVAGMWLFLKNLGGSASLLPLATLLAFAGRISGLGRGLYGGAFDDGFHPQWLAVCLLLWTYAGFLQNRPVWTGLLLGLTVLVHPVVALHGALVLFAASLVGSFRKLRQLLPVAGVCFLVGSPVITLQVWRLLHQRSELNGPVSEIIEKGFLFRAPHELTLELTPSVAGMSLVMAVVLALAGAVLKAQLLPHRALSTGVGLLFGHILLAMATILVQGGWVHPGLDRLGLIPYLLSLSRTTPLLLVLSALLITSGLESMFDGTEPGYGKVRLLRIVFLVCVIVFGAVFINWNAWFAGALVLVVVARVLYSSRQATQFHAVLEGIPSLALAVLLIVLLPGVRPQRLEAPIPEEQEELYSWVHDHTDTRSLFVIPPGFQEFRTYTLRSAYVDFKLFPGSSPYMIPEWRRRMELVASPDKLALGLRGWPAMYHWDRTYAQANDPARIATLLETTGADYFIYDKSGLDIPPFLPGIASRDDSRLLEVFSNQRYRVYQLRREP